MKAEERSGFAPGQRGPDFLLPNPDGEYGRFYDRFTGNLVALFFYPSNADPAAARELQNFISQAEAFTTAGTRIVTVARSAAQNKINAEHSIDFSLFLDPQGAVTRAYGGQKADNAGCTTYLFDRNQRVLMVFDGTGSHAGHVLDYLKTEVPVQAPARLIRAQAPVLLLPDVVDAPLRATIIQAWQENHEEGAVRRRAGTSGDAQTKAVDYGMKKRLDHRPGDALNQQLTQAVMSRIGPELYKVFQFQAVALERFCIAAYEANRGDFFKPHRDNTTEQTAKRRFAVTLNINDDYEGGGIKFPEFGEDVYSTAAGGAIVFSCSLMHEALPVTRGTRYAGLSFIFGPGDVSGPAPRQRA